jgi:hypothetical protein
MSGYTPLLLGLVVLAVATVVAMVVGRAATRRLRQPDVVNDTRHA